MGLRFEDLGFRGVDLKAISTSLSQNQVILITVQLDPLITVIRQYSRLIYNGCIHWLSYF